MHQQRHHPAADSAGPGEPAAGVDARSIGVSPDESEITLDALEVGPCDVVEANENRFHGSASCQSHRTATDWPPQQCQRQVLETALPASQLQPQPQPAEASGQLRTRSRSRPRPPSPRFVSDLNPEARLLDETTSPEDSQDVSPDLLGIWIKPRRCTTCGNGHQGRSPSEVSAPLRLALPVSDLLPEPTVTALSNIYFENIHPIIPILDQGDYQQTLVQGTVPMPLAHVVCLLAAKHHSAREHLRLLQSGDTVLSVRQFCTQLNASIVAGISRPKTVRKIVLVGILALLSLHHEGEDGAGQASWHIAQAIHHAQSMALHLQRPNDSEFDHRRVYWCLWTLDRLNAATHSRPCVISDADSSVEEFRKGDSGFLGFDVLLRIARLLNQVIGIYRPTHDKSVSGLEQDFPNFENIMDEMQAWQLPRPTIGLSTT